MNGTRILLALLVAWVAFAYRFSAPYFHNDHFEHLSMARQMLFGEFPIRDFIDPGRPLTVALSAVGQWLAPNLLSEAILTMGALAIGAAITFWLASAASRSLLLGLAAAAVVIMILPRLYSYPKILVFALVLLALWRYIDVPSVRRLAVLAATIVFAFLMRHDFGLYAGVAAAVAVFITPGPAKAGHNDPGPAKAGRHDSRSPAKAGHYNVRRVLAFVALGILLTAPYLVWLESIGRLRSTGSSGAERTLSWVNDADMPRPVPPLDLSRGIVHIDPVIAKVRVRWAPSVGTVRRQLAEAQFGLIQPVDEGERTFAYGLTDSSVPNLRALVNAQGVEDTGGINRNTLTIDAAWIDRWLGRIGVTRIVWGPFFDSNGAGIWLYYFVWVVPLAALVWLLATRGRTHPAFSGGGRKIAAAALLGIILNLYLIRGSFDSRVPDVIVPAAIVGAWLVREYLDLVFRSRLLLRPVLAAVGVAIAILFWASLTTYESTASGVRLLTAGLRVARLPPAAAELRQRPIDFFAKPGENGVMRLTRYVHDCLQPDDRLLLVAYEPEVFYYSERLFAGGMEYFHQRRFSTDQELAETVGRLSRQPVPLVIVERARSGMFEESYRPIADYVRRHYRSAASSTFGANRTWDVFASNARGVVRTMEDGLPCYR